MKYLLSVILAASMLLFSFGAIAETCTLPNDEIVENCYQEAGDNPPNVLVMYALATEREDNSPLPVDEIAGTKIYFNRLVDNWWPKITAHDNAITAVYIYMPPGEYAIFGTTIDTGGRESVASEKITSTIVGAVESRPKPLPPVINVPNIGTIIININ